MMNKPRTTRSCLAFGVLMTLGLSAAYAQNIVLRNDKEFSRVQRDTGKNIIQIEFGRAGDGNIWLKYAGGDLRNGWWHANWNVSKGQTYLKVGRHKVVGSPGYPKKATSVAYNKRANVRSRQEPRKTFRGRWQTGAYIWLESNKPDNEINYWARSYSASRSYTFHGDSNLDQSKHKTYSFNNSDGFKSWVMLRQKMRLPINIPIRRVTDVIRGYGMPNHNVYTIVWAVEGHNKGSTGQLNCSRYRIPGL